MEPALTNIGIVLPDEGYLAAVREVTRRHDVLLVIDETHTLCAGPGGCTAAWGLEPDLVVVGKPIGGGIPVAAYGMTAEVADRLLKPMLEAEVDVSGVGGTLTGSALAMAAVRATLSTALRAEDFAVAVPLAERFADGVAGVIAGHGLPWHVQRLGCRAEYWFCPPPRTGADAAAAVDEELEGFFHLWALNRGILLTPFHNMALFSPHHTEADVDLHTEVFADGRRGAARMIDPTPLWDFDDPEASEQRFRAQAELRRARRPAGPDDPGGPGAGPPGEVRRGPLRARRPVPHRGRGGGPDRARAWSLFRSEGDPEQARPLFEAAARSAQAAGLEALHVDALHMTALVADPADQLAIGRQALAVARASTDPQARDWDASLLNNIGMTHADAGDFDAALAAFEDALAARERIGDPRAPASPAGWWAGRCATSVAATRPSSVQRALKAELDAAGVTDQHVDEELALLEG